MTIADNVARVQDNIRAACQRVGRSPSEVTLLAVSKTHPPEQILAAAEAGVQHFGENRVEEAADKIPQTNARLPAPVTWHMVGHVQSRKARQIPALFQVVHSVDRLKLAAKLSERMAEAGGTLDLLLEINISGEQSKGGFPVAGWATDAAVRTAFWQVVEQILALPGVRVRGLMTMAPIVSNMEQARPIFAGLARLRAALAQDFGVALPDLSMGMTDDYPVAVEEGATIVRVGRAIFGSRKE